MKEGAISRFYDMQYFMKNLLEVRFRGLIRGSKYVVAVPTDVSEVEKRAFYDLVVHSAAKAKEVRFVERAVADAIGFGLDVENEEGIFVVNFGGATTDISVLSHGGLVLNRMIKKGGSHLDDAIQNSVRNRYNFLIGKKTAEVLRREFGIADSEVDNVLTVTGRDLMSGMPSQQKVAGFIVKAAMKEQLIECAKAIRLLLERTPPEVGAAIRENGIYLTGGVANMKQLSTFIEHFTEIPVHTIEEPESCVIRGLKKIITSDEYEKFTYSMMDESFRWIK
jgi:rod shape-determining protein MreB